MMRPTEEYVEGGSFISRIRDNLCAFRAMVQTRPSQELVQSDDIPYFSSYEMDPLPSLTGSSNMRFLQSYFSLTGICLLLSYF